MKDWLKTRSVDLRWAVGLLLSVALLSVSRGVFEGPLEVAEGLGKSYGAFGDLIGGLANPLISLVALCMLVAGYRIQREQLATARSDQAAQIQLAALTAGLDGVNADIQRITESIRHISDQQGLSSTGVYDARGKWVPSARVAAHKEELVKQLDKIAQLRFELITSINKLFKRESS